jgi:hypothetical protein
MVNSVKRLQEMKAFVRMGSGVDLRPYGWYGDGTSGNGEVTELLESMPGVVRGSDGSLQFTEWNCCAGQNNVTIARDEEDLPAPLFLHVKSQPGLLLQRRSSDQMAMVQCDQE